MGPLSELTLRVAEAAGVDVREMTTPYAEATCVDGEAGWVRNTDSTSGVTVSLTDGTASLEFCSTRGNPITPAPLAAGEALLYNTNGGACRLPTGTGDASLGTTCLSANGSIYHHCRCTQDGRMDHVTDNVRLCCLFTRRCV